MIDPTPILFTIPNFITAGSGRAMLNIIERLDRNRFSPAVCVMIKGGDLDREVERLGIPFIEAPFTISARPYLSLLSRAQTATQIFKPYKFKLWHSFHYSDDYTESIISHFAGAKWIYTKKNMNWGTNAWRVRSLLASRIAVQNTDMESFFSCRLFKIKMRFVPRGININRFLAKKTVQNKSAIMVGTVSHLVPVKGHPTLIEAIAKCDRSVHLVIAGKPMDPDYVAQLYQLVNRLGISDRVHFYGNAEDVPAFLAEIDIFVLPTWAKWRMEGCPVALLEAMACEKACIATDIPGSRDIIQNEENGFFVPPENPEAMAEKIQLLAENKELRTQMGQAARQRILDCYTIEREVSDHERLYEEILRK